MAPQQGAPDRACQGEPGSVKEESILKALKLSIFMIIAAFTVAACGGSSSAPPQTQTGTLAVMITDGPADDFEQILVTLDEMLLLGGDNGHQVVYDGPPITFDLLNLGDRVDFAFAGEIPADDYSKIRLKVSKIELVDLIDGSIGTVEPVDLPANGKIDLNPQGPFTIEPNQTTVVELDMDANRSFHVVELGNTLGYRLRPVFFVNVLRNNNLLPGKLVRVFGTVAEGSIVNTPDEQSALVCGLYFVSQIGNSTAGDADDCVRIFANPLTSIFDDTGSATDFSSIMDNGNLTGIGHLSVGDVDSLFNLEAVVMEIGDHQPPAGSGWETLRGTVVSPQMDCDMIPDSEQCFDFTPIDSATPIKTRLQPATRVFDSRGGELEHTDVGDMDTGTVDGLRVTNGTEELLAALVVLSAGDDGGLLNVSGTITSVAPGLGDYDVLTVDSETSVCVNDETELLRILVDDGTVTIVDVLDPITLDLSMDLEIEASGMPGDTETPDCDILASVVIVE